ncbi:3-hydroxyisobutyrate dehydrogenase-like beta-hydroxyacid dehydrogenase [Streptomyces sp. 1114.5]|uniref:NAD(P)-dependent oxidoreductase n=1 Tax=unclassified Streptomyces TaxID=2593676 RepID=UPI000BD9EA19|nr:MULTISPECIES: NAD(P)-dependent oxidoreductase [unclassified Streptomyces]RKT16865.1 3-hydroxyisobutyrate dehydrogenase-like beta-hydroxyacid dehydrogenase [Streptomyces sp. 1114.5]SOB83031.1 3-hydroxyisobutyrate dehydrogenase [Streptomyces sp. 1331.2]
MAGTTVGFVGLGAMGRGMAGSLLRAGHTVRVWNRSPEPVAEMVAEGAEAAGSLDEVFAADTVVSMLANDDAVERLLLDPALLADATATLHVNMATVSLALAERAEALHAEHGIGYVAAPVLGRPPVAAEGRLNILAAGQADLLARAEPLFAAMGQRTWHFGESPRQANTAKISTNFLLACAIESMAEACSLADANGVRPTDLIEMLTGTLFPGPVYSGYGAMVAERRYEPAGFRLPLGLKDVGLALDAGAARHVPLPFGSILRDAFLDALAHGDGDKDWAAVAGVARRRAGLPE